MRTYPNSHAIPTRELALFACAGVELPKHAAPNNGDIIRRYFLVLGPKSRQPLALACGERKLEGIATDYQLPLPFLPQPSTLIRLVPHHRHPCLDYGVYDTFYDVPGAVSAALKLEANRILLVGQLVQLSEEQVREFVDEKSFRAIEKELAFLGLGFGTRIPFWNRKFKSLLAAMP